MKVILASESPNKKRILEKTGLAFDIVPSDYEEDMTLDMPPEELAKELALGKARDVAEKHPQDIIIATDAFVSFEGRVIGKAKSAEEAKEVLASYRGKEAKVCCGLVVKQGGKEEIVLETAGVKFRDDLTDEEIENYVRTDEPLFHGGAFAAHKQGANLIESMPGDYSVVIGMPLYTTLKLLRDFGVNPLCPQ